MQQALRSLWSDDLGDELRRINAPLERQAEAEPENVVRAFPPARERSAGSPAQRARPELAAAIDAVSQATSLVEDWKSRAEQAEQRATLFAERAVKQMRDADSQIQAALERAGAAEERALALEASFNALSESAAEKARVAEEQIMAQMDRVSRVEEQAAERLREAEAQLRAGAELVRAAELRAQEAKEDLDYLEGYIRDRFSALKL
jgi:hypothetical protein